jgi:hypothetical protein
MKIKFEIGMLDLSCDCGDEFSGSQSEARGWIKSHSKDCPCMIKGKAFEGEDIPIQASCGIGIIITE